MEQIYEDLCRLCLKSNNCLHSMFIAKDMITIADKLAVCTQVNVNENDGLPRNVCMQCLSNLEESYKFQKMCDNSDKMLHSMHGLFLKMTHIKEDSDSMQNQEDKPISLETICDVYDASRSSDLTKRAIDYMNDLKFISRSVIKNVCDQHESTEINSKACPSDTASNVIVKNNHGTVEDVSENGNKNNSLVYIGVRRRFKAGPTKNSSELQTRIKTRKRSMMHAPPYNCPDCKQTFSCYKKILFHKRNMHNRRYSCVYCNKTFSSLSTRQEHMEKHSLVSVPVSCPICNKSCSSPKALRAHRLIHTEALKANCPVCHRVFSSPANMRRHMMIHTNQRPHMCHFCGVSFNQASTRDNHIMAKHSPEKIHRCKMCTMRFESIYLLQQHMLRHERQLENGSSSNYLMKPTCKECNKSFATQANLKNHMNWHSKPFLCIVCGKAYASKHALKNHERNHTGERPFSCQFCEKTFTVKGLLMSHSKTHEGDECKKYQCTYCPKKFALQSTLTSHVYTHTGERPFKCNVCDKTFNQRAHLRTHSYIHTGEKKHVCEFCNKAFSLKEGLRYHTMTHTGETPFSCTQCGKGFYIPYKLKVHMLKVHHMELKTDNKL